MVVLAAPITTGLTMVNAQTPRPVDNRDRRWGTWMVAAQTGDRTAYETLLRDCISGAGGLYPIEAWGLIVL